MTLIENTIAHKQHMHSTKSVSVETARQTVDYLYLLDRFIEGDSNAFEMLVDCLDKTPNVIPIYGIDPSNVGFQIHHEQTQLDVASAFLQIAEACRDKDNFTFLSDWNETTRTRNFLLANLNLETKYINDIRIDIRQTAEGNAMCTQIRIASRPLQH